MICGAGENIKSCVYSRLADFPRGIKHRIAAVCRNGAGVEFSEDEAKVVLGEDEIYINIDLGQGDASAKAWGCDLTYDYVKINGDYRS